MSPISGISTGRQRQKLSPSVCLAPMVPLPGQMFIAAIVAVRWRANLPLSVDLNFCYQPTHDAGHLFCGLSTWRDHPRHPGESDRIRNDLELVRGAPGGHLGTLPVGLSSNGNRSCTAGIFRYRPLMALASG